MYGLDRQGSFFLPFHILSRPALWLLLLFPSSLSLSHSDLISAICCLFDFCCCCFLWSVKFMNRGSFLCVICTRGHSERWLQSASISHFFFFFRFESALLYDSPFCKHSIHLTAHEYNGWTICTASWLLRSVASRLYCLGFYNIAWDDTWSKLIFLRFVSCIIQHVCFSPKHVWSPWSFSVLMGHVCSCLYFQRRYMSFDPPFW